MSLKVNQHVLATSFPVSSSATILEGQVVTLNSSGECVLADDTATTAWVLGFAGDAKSTLSAGSFANRAWELGDETNASSRITVYRGFGTELYVDTTDVICGTAPTIGGFLYLSTTAGKISTDTMTNSIYAARCIDDLSANSGYLDSGIPNVNVPVTDSDSPRTFYLISVLTGQADDIGG